MVLCYDGLMIERKWVEDNNINRQLVEFKGLTNSDPNEKIKYLQQYIIKNNINKILLFEDNNKVITEAKNTLIDIKLYLF